MDLEGAKKSFFNSVTNVNSACDPCLCFIIRHYCGCSCCLVVVMAVVVIAFIFFTVKPLNNGHARDPAFCPL